MQRPCRRQRHGSLRTENKLVWLGRDGEDKLRLEARVGGTLQGWMGLVDFDLSA